MTGRTASFLLLTFSVLMAMLVFLGRISGETSGWAFAIALAGLGLLSRGFRRR